MSNKYFIDFEKRLDDKYLYLALIKYCNKQIKNAVDNYGPEQNMNKTQKKEYKKFDKRSNFKNDKEKEVFESDKLRFIIKTDKKKYLCNKINTIIANKLKTYKDTKLFSLDEDERCNAIIEICSSNPEDKKVSDPCLLGFIFDIAKQENKDKIDAYIEDYNKKVTEKEEEDKKDSIIESLRKELEDVKKEKNAQKIDYDKKIDALKKSNKGLNKEIEENNNKIDKLEKSKQEDKDKLTGEFTEIITGLKEEIKKLSLNNNASEGNCEVTDNSKNASLNENLLKRKLFTGNQVINAISATAFIGRANFKSLQKYNHRVWMLGIIPRDDMMDDMNLSDLDDFNKKVLIKNYPVSYLSLLDDFTINRLFPGNDFKYLEDDEQKSFLFENFKDKEILFNPSFSDDIDGEKKCNADIVDVIKTNENEYFSTTLVPELTITIDDLIKNIESKKQINIIDYSQCLHTTLKYVVCENKLIQVDMEPGNGECFWVTKDCEYKIILDDFSNINSDEYSIGFKSYNENVFYFIKNDVISFLKNNESKKNIEDKIEDLQKTDKKTTISNEVDFIKNVKLKAYENHLDYSYKDIANFHIALKSSQLVIVAGTSGTGKTQLPFIYTKTLSMAEELKNVLFVPITPSYTEPSDVLGYFKPNIKEDSSSDGTYMESETGLVSFLLEASKNRKKLYAVIFDEMNLSQIEYWFSPFLSVLERKVGERQLRLYSDTLNCSNASLIPPVINIYENVLFIGTINLDETTKDLSDRLSDRAIVVNLEKKDINSYFNNMNTEFEEKSTNIDNSAFFSFIKNKENYIIGFTKEEINFFVDLNELIHSINSDKDVSYRTLKMISNYLNNAKDLEEYISRSEALDLILKETVITKIKGSDNSVKRLLDSETGINSVLNKYNNLSDFEETKEALDRKLSELNNYGYTR